MGVTVCHLLITVIEFSSPSSTLWDSHFRPSTLSPYVATLPFYGNLLLSFHPPLYCHHLLILCAPPQPSPAATLAAPSTDAPLAMASTTMTWCASPATKATLWKGRLPPSARPPASGASSPRHAGVGSSLTAPTEGRTVTMSIHAQLNRAMFKIGLLSFSQCKSSWQNWIIDGNLCSSRKQVDKINLFSNNFWLTPFNSKTTGVQHNTSVMSVLVFNLTNRHLW